MTDLTKIFSNFVSQATLQNFNDEMIFFSKMSMIDWCGVAYAAKEEPVSKIVTKLIDEEQTKGLSRLISNGKEVSAKSAAFVNGTIGHALDYDDTHFLFTGHPTASAFPTALALGEELGSSIDEIILLFDSLIMTESLIPPFDCGMPEVLIVKLFSCHVQEIPITVVSK